MFNYQIPSHCVALADEVCSLVITWPNITINSNYKDEIRLKIDTHNFLKQMSNLYFKAALIQITHDCIVLCSK